MQRYVLAAAVVTVVAAQMSVPADMAMQHWSLEVKYHGLEQEDQKVLLMMKAFAQHFIDHGTEPPREKFPDLEYHQAWSRLRWDLRNLFDERKLATSYNSNKDSKEWFTCGLIHVRSSPKVGFCVSFKALHFPPPCSDPVKMKSGLWTCPNGAKTTLYNVWNSFCCHSWLLEEDRCGSCTDAESNGDPRNWCNWNAENCFHCTGRSNPKHGCEKEKPTVAQHCLGTNDKTSSVSPSPSPVIAPEGSDMVCCWGGDTCGAATSCGHNGYCDASEERCHGDCAGKFCLRNSVPIASLKLQDLSRQQSAHLQKKTERLSRRIERTGSVDKHNTTEPTPRKKMASRTTRSGETQLPQKESIFLETQDATPTEVSSGSFFMHITPVMPTGETGMCAHDDIRLSGCYTLCCDSEFVNTEFCRTAGHSCF